MSKEYPLTVFLESPRPWTEVAKEKLGMKKSK